MMLNSLFGRNYDLPESGMVLAFPNEVESWIKDLGYTVYADRTNNSITLTAIKSFGPIRAEEVSCTIEKGANKWYLTEIKTSHEELWQYTYIGENYCAVGGDDYYIIYDAYGCEEKKKSARHGGFENFLEAICIVQRLENLEREAID